MSNPSGSRRLGPRSRVVVDVVGNAAATRGWLVMVIIVLAGLAAILASAGQLLPWLIYPAL